MKHYVLVQEPRRKGVYIQCAGIDQCLKVVEREGKTTLSGTRLTMIRKAPRKHGEPLAMWRVERQGLQRYRINPDEGMWEAVVDQAAFMAPRMMEIDKDLSPEAANWNHNMADGLRTLGKHGMRRAEYLQQHYIAVVDSGYFDLGRAQPHLDEIGEIDALLRDEIEGTINMILAWREAQR